jgi:O-acetyl-ADP-ribose deacetylase
MNSNTKLSLDNIDAVLAFLPMLETSKGKLYTIDVKVSMMDPYVYSSEVSAFIRSLYREGFVIDFNWPKWSEQAKQLVDHPDLLAKADLDSLRKLLTAHVRAERFVSGHLAKMLDSGHIVTILKRLKQLRVAMSSTQTQSSDWSDRVRVVQGDITQQVVDAIVNAANESLLGGGGVDGAIHRAAGPQLLAECHTLKGCAAGEAKITQGYRLPAKWVIHTVGPVWQGGDHQEDKLLAQCYRNSLALAQHQGIRSLAFPAISTGVYRFPLERATRIAVTEVKQFLSSHPSIAEVRFVCFGEPAHQCYLKTLKELEA